MRRIKLSLIIIVIWGAIPGGIIPFASCGGPSQATLEKFRQAMKLYNNQQIKRAENLFREVLFEDGDFVDAHLMLGRLYFYKNNNQLAEIALLEAARLDEANLTARYYLARLYYLDFRRHPEALELLNYILKKNSGFTQAWRLKGAIYEKRGDTRRAISAYQYAIIESKKIARVHRRLSRLYSRAQLPTKSKTSLQTARCLSAGDAQLRLDFN